MDSHPLIFRADASVTTATGHAMRCLALAQAWQDEGGCCVFAMTQSLPAIEARLRSERIEIVDLAAPPGSAEDAAGLIQLAREKHARWVVVDGYCFCADYQHSLKNAGLKQLFVDDTGHAGEYCADLVLDQNAHAQESLYGQREAHTRLLLGSRFALLRREFAQWRGWTRIIPKMGRKVIVMMGGSDPDNVSQRVMDALRLVTVTDLEAVVVAGGSNPNLGSLERAVASCSQNVRLERNVTNIGELMAWADAAVSASGSTCWEMCLLGLPALLIHLAPNQRPVAEELDRRGIALHLGSQHEASATKIVSKLEWLLASSEARASMSQRGRELVDGRGASRVVAAMRNHGLQLRRVREDDCRLLWEWANDPEVRSASFTQGAIGWNEHVDWFSRKLQDPGCVMLIATNEQGTLLGQVRCEDAGEGEAEIHVSLAKESRGHGYASSLIYLAAQSSWTSGGLKNLHAWIKPDNPVSSRAFESAGFVRVNSGSMKGCSADHYVRYRSQAASQR